MFENKLKEMKQAAILAQEKILEVYSSSFDVEMKEDDSPVTEADKAADKIIRDYLHSKFPNHAFLTEESVDTKERLNAEWIFIVDPVDGTNEFVKRSGGFATNIALCHKHEIVAAVINIPARKTLYFASKGDGAYRQEQGKEPERIHCSDRLSPNLRVLVSANYYSDEEKAVVARNKSHFESVSPCGAALKFCMVAEGSAELAIRYTRGTKEWDTAVGDLLIHEAGGYFLQPDLTPFTYNKEDVHNHKGYIAINNLKNALD